MKVSWDDDIPNMMGKITFMFQTTNQMMFRIFRKDCSKTQKPSQTIRMSEYFIRILWKDHLLVHSDTVFETLMDHTSQPPERVAPQVEDTWMLCWNVGQMLGSHCQERHIWCKQNKNHSWKLAWNHMEPKQGYVLAIPDALLCAHDRALHHVG